MLPTTKIRKVIWALDAFPEDRGIDRAAASAMRAIFKGHEPEIQPVYVLVPDEIDRLSLSMNDFWQRQYREGAMKSLTSFAGRIKLANLREPVILENPRGSLRGGIEVLNEYAKSSGANLIVVSSHARKGLARMFLGSFTESLLMRSEVPVLTINPHMQAIRAVKNVLFPTDLTDTSREAFGHVVHWASEQGGTEVTLFHLVPDQLRFIAGTGIMLADGGYYATSDILEREFEARKERAEEWAAWAKQEHGVIVNTIVRRSSGEIARNLLAYAKRTKPSLIAMSSEKGPASTIFLGSTTRQVVRGAQCPVWVFHYAPGKEAAAESKPGKGLKTAKSRSTKGEDEGTLGDEPLIPPTLLI